MEQDQGYRRYLSTGNKIVVNRQFLGLGHTLQSKKKERKISQYEHKQLANRLMKLQQTQNKTMKDLQKKYQQLQNIYKIRLRKQSEQQNKQRLRKQKEQQIKILKLQWREERERNAAKKKASMDQLMEKNRGSYLFEKNSKKSQQHHRNESLKKTLQQNINKTIEVKQNKESGLHKIIEYKRSKNKQSIEQYKSRMEEEEQKKIRNFQRIKNLSSRHEKKKIDLEKNLNEKAEIEDLIKRAHELDLHQLQKLVISHRPNQSRNDKRSLSRVSSKNSLRSSKSLMKTQRNQRQLNPQSDIKQNRKQKPKTVQLSNNQDIEDTIKVIEQLENLNKNHH